MLFRKPTVLSNLVIHFGEVEPGVENLLQLGEHQTLLVLVEVGDVDSRVAKVQRGGKLVTAEHVERARREGASDVEIHDTLLIAAAFCTYNRYVDGLDTWQPQMPACTPKWANISPNRVI